LLLIACLLAVTPAVNAAFGWGSEDSPDIAAAATMAMEEPPATAKQEEPVAASTPVAAEEKEEDTGKQKDAEDEAAAKAHLQEEAAAAAAAKAAAAKAAAAAAEAAATEAAAKQEEEANREKTSSSGAVADAAEDLVAFQKLLFGLAARVGLTASMASGLLYALLAIYLLSFVNGTAGHMWWRLGLWSAGIFHMFLSTDARFNPKKQPDPELVVRAMSNDLSERLPTRRIIFIRHGESCWNEVFNRGYGPTLLLRLLKATLNELKCVFGNDSVFLDSPLSKRGLEQCDKLRDFVQSNGQGGETKSPEALADLASMRGEGRPSVMVTSNLRRAIATVAIGLWPRLREQGDKQKIHLLSSLQEGSRNVDCMCLAGRGEVPPLKQVKKHLDTEAFQHGAYFNTDFNAGNKAIFGSGLARLRDFAGFCMAPELEGQTIIAGGHSLWFRTFFQTFLPHETEHIAKVSKMVNCGAVGFTLTQGEVNGELLYRIDPKSIVPIFGPIDEKKNPEGDSFEKKKK